MFKCASCGVSALPRTGLVLQVTRVRKTLYSYYDPETEEMKASSGSEIESEVKLGPCCSGVPARVNSGRGQVKPDSSLIAGAISRFGLASKGHEPNPKVVEFFSSIPLPSLSVILENEPAPRFTQHFSAMAMEGMMERSYHNSKRSKADVLAGAAVLGGYEKRGGGL